MKDKYEIDLRDISRRANMNIRQNQGIVRQKNVQEGKYTLKAYVHDAASVASGECVVLIAEENIFREKLRNSLKSLADRINEKNGFVGHIKAGIEYTHTEMMSVTDTDLQEKKGPNIRIRCNITAIVFGIEIEELKRQTEDIFQELCTFSSWFGGGSV